MPYDPLQYRSDIFNTQPITETLRPAPKLPTLPDFSAPVGAVKGYTRGTMAGSTPATAVQPINLYAPQSVSTPIAPTPVVTSSVTSKPVVSTTPINYNERNMAAAGLTPEQMAGVRAGTGYTTTATPGSAASVGAPTPAGLFTQTPEDIASQTEYERMLAEQRTSANQVVDPNQIYQEMLRQRQAQIDAINNVYADRLTQARIQGQGRIESRQFAQGRAGQIGSGTGEAGINAVQDANVAQQNAIQNEKALAIQGVYAKIDEAVKAEAAAKTAARTQSAEKYMETLRQQPEKRKKLLASSIAELVARGVDVNEMTPEEIDSYIEGLKSTPEEFEAEFNKQASIAKKTAEQDLAKKEQEAFKALPAMAQEYEYAKKEGYKGTFSQYQNEDANRKAIATKVAKEPSLTEKKASALIELSNYLVPGQTLPGTDGIPVIDQNGFITPEGFKTAINAAQKEGVTRKEFLAEYGNLLFPESYTVYGITPQEIKSITGEIPAK